MMKQSIWFKIFFALALNATFATAQETPKPTPPEGPPATSVQIVNATSVPAIALEVNGKLNYPDFPQGKFTADAPTEGLKYQYKVINKSDGTSVEPKVITFKNQENQTLLILGDFSREAPEGKMPQLYRQESGGEAGTEFPPNVLLRVYSHQDDSKKAPVCLRIINGMPRKSLRFKSPVTKSDVQLFPGDEIQLEGQPLVQSYGFVVDGKPYIVHLRQDSNPRNANIVFFLKDNQPVFLCFYQSTGQPLEMPDAE
jgi:hypothetical protein